MKWKVIIKLLYLTVLLGIVALEGKRKPQLIDSDPSTGSVTIYHVALQD